MRKWISQPEYDEALQKVLSIYEACGAEVDEIRNKEARKMRKKRKNIVGDFLIVLWEAKAHREETGATHCDGLLLSENYVKVVISRTLPPLTKRQFMDLGNANGAVSRARLVIHRLLHSKIPKEEK